jgi:heme/copper-type cytochrome/quinol oxidase subunit 2
VVRVQRTGLFVIAVVVIGVIVAGMLAFIAWRRRNAQAD